MTLALSRSPVDATTRARFLFVTFSLAAAAAGVLSAAGSEPLLESAAICLLVSFVALTVPLVTLPVVAAALVPIQFYFFVPSTSYAVPAAQIFLIVAGLRVILELGIRACLRGWHWLVPAGCFLLIALVAAFFASDRYQAFKGIYEWLPIVGCVYLVSQTVRSQRAFDHVILVLVAGGTLQAVLGILEYVAGLDRVLGALASPIAGFMMQPNLLQERLSDLSFNWVLSGRALPFGTFINAIDYAIFLAAALLLAITKALSQRSRARLFWLCSAFVMGAALVLTLKGSGLLALVGGGIALAICWAPRISRQKLSLVLPIAAVAILLITPFAESISQRAAFLVQREQNEFTDVGRLRIWASLLTSLASRPLFGYGLNNSELIAEPTRTLRGGAFAFNPTSPESSYVETLVETGLLGFAALMCLFGITLVRGFRRARADANAAGYAGVVSALAAILFGNLTVSGFTTEQNGMMLGILIGLVFAKWNAA